MRYSRLIASSPAIFRRVLLAAACLLITDLGTAQGELELRHKHQYCRRVCHPRGIARATVKCIAYALAATLLASSAQADPWWKWLEGQYLYPERPTVLTRPPKPNGKETLYRDGQYPFGLGDKDFAALERLQQIGSPFLLPPIQYDRPYDRALLVIEVDLKALVTIADQISCTVACVYCGESATNVCAEGIGCTIIHAPEDDIVRQGMTLAIVMRHEIGHCNGWPADHRGGRGIKEVEEEAWRKRDEKAAETWRRVDEEKAARGER